jgi:hypothetical protein
MSREMLDGKREQSQLLGVRLRSDGKDYLRDPCRRRQILRPQRDRAGERLYALPDGASVPRLL